MKLCRIVDNISLYKNIFYGGSVFFLLPVYSGIATSFEGKHGSIRYWLKAEMDKPWSFNHKTKKAFTVISPIDINKAEYQVSKLTYGMPELTLFPVKEIK